VRTTLQMGIRPWSFFTLDTADAIATLRCHHNRGDWQRELRYVSTVDPCSHCGTPGHYWDMLLEQIQKDGQIFSPVCLNGDQLRDGTHRLLAAHVLGIESLPAYSIPYADAPEPDGWEQRTLENLAPLFALGSRVPDLLGNDSDPMPGVTIPRCVEEPDDLTEYARHYKYLSRRQI